MPGQARYYALAERPLIADETGSYYGLPAGTIGSVDLAPIGSHSHVFVTSEKPFSKEGVAVSIGDGTRLDEHRMTATDRSAWQKLVGVVLPAGTLLLDAIWQTLTADADPDGELRAKPLMPTHRGNLDLHLGGHSIVRSERLPKNPTKHPAWPAMQRVLQRDYQRVRTVAGDEARRGRGRGKDGKPTLNRKWLGAMQRKYRLTPEAARDLIGDARDGLALPPTTTISESFDQADSTTLGPDLTWTEVLADMTTVSNEVESNEKLHGQSNARSRAETDLSSDDHYAQLDCTHISRGVFSGFGAGARFSGSADTGYFAFRRNKSGEEFRLVRIVTGSKTEIGLVSLSSGLPTTVRVTADGSTIAASADGTELISVTDTNITGNTRTGIHAATTVDVLTRGDNFEAADLVAAASVLPPPLLMMQMTGSF